MTEIREITKQTARRFLLLRHGLLGAPQFEGKEGVFAFVKQFGCVQYDPIDVCGKNHELVFQSRIPGFQKEWVHELLYEERRLLDWFDKNMSLIAIEDWVFFAEARERAKTDFRNAEDVAKVRDDVLGLIREKGPVNSSDLGYSEKVDWWWAPTSFSRVVLDALYYQGDLIVAHKKNTRKFYDLAENYLEEAALATKIPFEDEAARFRWHVVRRIRGVGMLHWNASYAFIGIHGLKAAQRDAAFEALLADETLVAVQVMGIEKPFYLLREELPLLAQAEGMDDVKERMEFLAPLDNLLWDREIVEELFDFSYKWEIYTPVKDREYGYYVLPILYGDALIGRIELKRNRKTKEFDLLGMWFEEEDLDVPAIHAMVTAHAAAFEALMY